jgi:hypothetical protein
MDAIGEILKRAQEESYTLTLSTDEILVISFIESRDMYLLTIGDLGTDYFTQWPATPEQARNYLEYLQEEDPLAARELRPQEESPHTPEN